MEKDEFVELTRKAIRGDKIAFSNMVQLKMKNLFYYAYRIVKDYHDAEDVVQEAVMKSYKGIGCLKQPEAIHAWLLCIVRNECFAYLKKNSRYTIAIDDGDDRFEMLETTDEESIPEKYLENKERSDELCQVLLNLPSRQRDVIVLHYFEELSYKEISNLHERSIQTVSTYMVKARMSIKRLLETA